MPSALVIRENLKKIEVPKRCPIKKKEILIGLLGKLPWRCSEDKGCTNSKGDVPW